MIVVHTFWRAGMTWTSSRLTKHRIDYFLAVRRVDVISCEVRRDMDLTFNATEDHNLECMTERVPPSDVDETVKKEKPFRINKMSLANVECCENFKDKVWEFEFDASMDIHGKFDALNAHVREAAMEAFGPPIDVSRKPWLSDET